MWPVAPSRGQMRSTEVCRVGTHEASLDAGLVHLIHAPPVDYHLD
jgi:hypothetical protein